MTKLKHCKKCNTDKPLEGFSFLERSKDGYNYYCRERQNKANRKCWPDYYKRNKERFRQYDKERYLENATKIRVIKDVPCKDCGQRFPYYVMDFDHVRGEKKFVISGATCDYWPTTLEEIEKCDVVCSNCHRIRTHSRNYHKEKVW